MGRFLTIADAFLNENIKQASASARPVAESPSPATSPSALGFAPLETAPFPGGGAWLEARANSRAHANRRCSDPAVGIVHGSSSPQQELYALGSLAALRAVAKPPQAEKTSTTTIEEFVSRPLTLVSVDTPRLCLTAPNVAASSPEKNREEGVDVAVSACNVPGAATPSGATVFSVENAPKSSSDGGVAAAPSPAAVSSSSASAAAPSSPALRFRSLPRRSIENAPVTTAGAHSGAAAGPIVDLRPASAKAAAAAAAKPATVDSGGGGGGPEDKEEASRCLVASGGRARLTRCPAPSSPSFAASTWRVAPANVTVASLVVDDDFGDASSTPPRGPRGAPRYAWTTTTGFLLVNQASGDCASASGEIAACDPRADGMLFSLCSGPGKCAQFERPEC